MDTYDFIAAVAAYDNPGHFVLDPRDPRAWIREMTRLGLVPRDARISSLRIEIDPDQGVSFEPRFRIEGRVEH